jgi:glutathione peroxidase-family protein
MVKILSNKKDVFDFEEFMHKVKLRPNMLVPCGTTEQYVEVIENIYNYKRSGKVNLRY